MPMFIQLTARKWRFLEVIMFDIVTAPAPLSRILDPTTVENTLR